MDTDTTTDLNYIVPVAREPFDTRPLTCKCNDNKSVAAVSCVSLAPVTVSCTSDLQRGFVPGRQILQNVLEMDSMSRILAMRCMHSRSSTSLSNFLPHDSVAKLACLALFDYQTAFPSVIHKWIFLVLGAIGAPEGFVNLVSSMYREVKAYMDLHGVPWYLFDVMGGVLTGCPLSSVLFNFAIDPLLFFFLHLVIAPKLGRALACADDIAACFRHLQTLVIIANIFDVFSKFSGLILNPRKCILVLLSVVCTESVVDRIRAWLRVHVPSLADIQIANHGKYLGIFLGPSAFSVQWQGPIVKFKNRAHSINTSGVSARVACKEYNSKAVSVLAYVAQVSLPPKNLTQIELAALTKLLHLATSSMSYSSLMYCKHHMGLNFIPLGPYFEAIRVRAGVSTLKDVQWWHEYILSISRDCLPLYRAYRREGSPLGWDSPAIAFCLSSSMSFSKHQRNSRFRILCLLMWPILEGLGLYSPLYSITCAMWFPQTSKS